MGLTANVVAAGAALLRPGVKRLVQEAVAAGGLHAYAYGLSGGWEMELQQVQHCCGQE
jgi:hypothetical protein